MRLVGRLHVMSRYPRWPGSDITMSAGGSTASEEDIYLQTVCIWVWLLSVQSLFRNLYIGVIYTGDTFRSCRFSPLHLFKRIICKVVCTKKSYLTNIKSYTFYQMCTIHYTLRLSNSQQHLQEECYYSLENRCYQDILKHQSVHWKTDFWIHIR